MNDIVFGEKLANQAYMNREGAYGIILNDTVFIIKIYGVTSEYT